MEDVRVKIFMAQVFYDKMLEGYDICALKQKIDRMRCNGIRGCM